jgi:hypothetical protein
VKLLRHHAGGGGAKGGIHGVETGDGGRETGGVRG